MLESNTPSLLNSSTENGTFWKENISSKVVTKEDLIKNVNIPSHEPSDLTEHQINPNVAKAHHKFQHHSKCQLVYFIKGLWRC